MKKYSKNELLDLFETSNLSCYKLGKILDILPSRVSRYLFNGRKISPEEMMKIDVAVKTVKETGISQPKWSVNEWWEGDEWREVVGIWNDKLKERIRREVQHKEERALDEILFVIGFANINEYCLTYDPLEDCGLDNYSVDEFERRITEKIHHLA